MAHTTAEKRLAAQKAWRRRKEAAFHHTASFLQDSRIRVGSESVEVALNETLIMMDDQSNMPSLKLIQEVGVEPWDEGSNSNGTRQFDSLDDPAKDPAKEENSDNILVQHESSSCPFCCEIFRELALLTNDDIQASRLNKKLEVHPTEEEDVPPCLGETSQGSVGTDSTSGSTADAATAASALTAQAPSPPKSEPRVKTNFFSRADETSIESILFTTSSPQKELEQYFLSEPFLSEISKDRFRAVLKELRQNFATGEQDGGPSTLKTTGDFQAASTVSSTGKTKVLLSSSTEPGIILYFLALLFFFWLSTQSTDSASATSVIEDNIFTPQWLLIEENF